MAFYKDDISRRRLSAGEYLLLHQHKKLSLDTIILGEKLVGHRRITLDIESHHILSRDFPW